MIYAFCLNLSFIFYALISASFAFLLICVLDLGAMSVNNLLKVIDKDSTAVLVGLEPATSESLVRDLTTTPPSHRAINKQLALFK